MVSVRISTALTTSLALVTAASSALASSDTCDPGNAVDVATLRATRSYNPPRFEDDARSLQRPSWFFAPPAARVVSGQAGPFLASLIWRDSSGGIGACVYQGTGRQAHSPTCAGNGDEYRLTQCALLTSSGITFFGAEGLIREATSVRFHILAGDSCAPTISELELTSPPDRDADGLPDCLEPSRDTSPPTWPPGSTLAVTASGNTATLVWTAATDNVAVAGYRLYEDGVVVDELGPSQLSAQVASLSPNLNHFFQVQAFDAAGNQSTNGPSTVALIDTLPPVWPPGSTLGGTIAGGTVTLVWTAATDNVGVVGYRLFQEGQRVQDLPASTLTTSVTGLAPNAPHAFQVQAMDAAGNISSDGPSTVVLEDTLAPTWPAASALSAAPTSLASAILTWTSAADNVGVVSYRVFANGLPLAQTDGGSLSTTIVGLDPSVLYTFQVQAVDAVGNASGDGPQARLRLDLTPPTWPSDRSLLAAVTGAQGVHLAWTAAVDDIGVVQYVVYQDDILVRTVDGNTRSADVVGLDAAAAQVFRIEAVDAAGNASTNGPTASVHIGTPSPALVAPALDTNAGTTVLGAFSFLTEGSNPIQTGVAPGTVVKPRAALVRGHVSDRDGVDLQDVTVTILRHPELGTTQTHLDGTFDLLVNGGDDLAIKFTKPGYLPVQRHVLTSWNSTHSVTDVALVALDTNVTEIVSDAATSQVARGSVVSDADGPRQATLVIPSDTSASLLMADGSTVPLPSYHVRATEYTVGPLGPQAMPGDLPPLSGYTYAVELNADEAISSGAQSVVFSKPVTAFVENFLGFPVGETVPVGFYDRARGQWVASDSGQIIGIVGAVGGLATIDVDGDGLADDASKLAPLGITDEERAELAQMYTSGTSLWRFQAPHFTTYDCNWARILPSDAIFPTGTPVVLDTLDHQPCPASGSIIECDNQILGENIGITGTAVYLHYQSDRTLGRTAERTIDIPLIAGAVPPSLSRIDLDITIAGQRHHSSFTPQPNLATTFVWDGRDVYGRVVTGTHHATVTVTYPYPQIYQRTLRFGLAAFVSAVDSQGIDIQVANANREISLAKTVDVTLFSMPTTADNSLGGWTLSASHLYDQAGSLLYHGDGLRELSSARVKFVHLNSVSTQAVLAVPDGSVVYTQTNNLWKLAPDGTVARIAGSPSGVGGFSGDGGPALLARMMTPTSLALGPDGSIYFLDGANNRVRRIDPLGFINSVAGNGTLASTGDGGPATAASISPAQGTGSYIAVDRSANLYIAETFKIRRVTPDGEIALYAGKGCASLFCYSGDGSPALLAQLSVGGGIAAGPDGSLYVASAYSNTVRRIDRQGIISKVVGNGQENPSGDDGPAVFAATNPGAIAVDGQGRLNIFESSVVSGNVIRQVDSAGLIHTIAGTKGSTSSHDGDPPLAFIFQIGIWTLDFFPGGQLLSQYGGALVTLDNGSRLGDTTAFAIPSRDGSEYYGFDAFGRHVSTRDTLNGATLLSLGYTGNQLASLTDVDGNQLQIGHPDSSTIVLTAPFGQRTTLGLNAVGRLISVTNPLDQTIQLSYTRTDLLASLQDPILGTSTFEYDADGRLTKDTNAGGGYQTLSRTQQGPLSQVTRTTRLGRTTTYATDLSHPSAVAKTATAADAHSTSTVNENGSRTVSYPDGTHVSGVIGQDPRFGMGAPILSSATLTTSGGRTQTLAHTETVTLVNPNDPMSLSGLSFSTTVGGNRTWSSSYAASTRTMANTSPTGRKLTSTTFDANGRLVQLKAPGRLPKTFEYDGRGHLIAAQQGTRSAAFEYDSAGNLAHITLPDGRDVRASYDLLGRLLTMTRPDGRQVQLSYELAGRRVSTSPPGRPAHASELNPEGRTAEYRPPVVGEVPANRLWQFDFDNFLQTTTNGDGETIRVDRDAAGRPIQLNTTRGTFTYEYNQTAGPLTGSHTPEGQSKIYTYDGPLLLDVGITGEVSGDVAFDYDANLRLATETVNGDPIQFGYDDENVVTQVGALVIQRDPASLDVTAVMLDGVSLGFQRNGYGEVDHLDAAFGSTAIFTDDVLARDAIGKILARRETVTGESHTHDYTYDAIGRLTDVAVDGVPSAHYAYDDNGSRTERDGTGSVQSLSYDAQDRLVSADTLLYSYTADGALDTIVDTATGATTTYGYDAAGNMLDVVLSSGDRIDYVVDAAGRRVGRKVNGALTNRWIYGAADGPAAEVSAAGEVLARFVYATKSWVPAYVHKGGASYAVVTDRVGSVRLVINTSTGTVAQRLDYDEFGRVLLDTNPGFQPFGFAGGLYDKDTGLVRLGARDYDPASGRWTSKDPLLFGGGDTNLYAYCGSNPINCTDPSGLRDPDLATPRQTCDDTNDLATAVNILDATVTQVVDLLDFGGAVVTAFLSCGCALDQFLDRNRDRMDALDERLQDRYLRAEQSTTPKAGSSGGPSAGKKFPKSVKDAARAESQDTCVFCKRPTTRTPGPDRSHIDHAHPRSRGGNATLDNAQNTCETCNLAKGPLTTEEYLRQLP